MDESAYTPKHWIIYLGRFISQMGDRIYMIALSLFLVKHGEQLLLLWSIRMLVPFFFSYLSGTLVDRFGFRNAALSADFLCAIATALIPLTLGTPFLFFLVALNTFGTDAFTNAFNPLITSITTPETRHRVNTMTTTFSYVAMVFGPLIGGYLVISGDTFPFYAQSLSFLLSAGSLLLLRLNVPKPASGSRKFALATIKEDLQLAVSYLKKSTLLKRVMTIMVIMNLGAGAIDAYEAIYITKGVHLNATGYSIFLAINGLAFVVSGMINMRLAKRITPRQSMAIGGLITPVGIITYVLGHSLATVGAGVAVMGLGIMSMMTASRTIRQNLIPIEVQGRVLGALATLNMTAGSISVLVGGALVPFVPIRTIMIGCSLFSVIAIPVCLSVLRLNQEATEPVAA
ncbi:MFS transporter [Ferroacidibacillus organovorans]|uniref:Major facilitator superfamily (MFS) profile domain-containing protein n=1 Tax=Ferroacidibacillus organovorans TaxID=1765683 RepID=A0A101XTK7_9BACL|nr:MFS transporter [Ferroacidibacillus organovorans]KUO97357.1 hypothetical protein ATW55_05650 [Ferroacidibacillus organovorans]